MNAPKHRTLPLVFSLLAGCSEYPDPYEKVEGLRLLAIVASPPALLPNDNATLTALVTEDVTYAWNWCPFADLRTGECAISHEDFQSLAAPLIVPRYDLGSGESALFPYSLPASFYKDLCDKFAIDKVPDGFDVPDCSDHFEIQIGLTVTQGDSSIRSITKVDLLFDEGKAPNQNPILSGIRANEIGATPRPLDASEPTPMKRGVPYALTLDIDEGSSESYLALASPNAAVPTEQREALIASWFYQAGEMDKLRSSYIPGVTKLGTLRTNQWTPPSKEEFSDDYTTLYVVIRDGRGGISWQEREIELVSN